MQDIIHSWIHRWWAMMVAGTEAAWGKPVEPKKPALSSKAGSEKKSGPRQPTKGQSKPWTLKEFGGKTIWDWMGLLIVPIVLSLITVVFAWQQDARQQRIEDQRAQEAQKIEDQRAKAERELADQRAQDEALQAYLSQMGSLILERDLRTSKEDSEVRTLARARTLTVLGRLDPSRKTAVMQFLAEAKLLQKVEGRGAIIKFSGADLSGADLTDVDDNLGGANLSDADLSGANLDCYPDVNQAVPNLFTFDAGQRCSDLSGADLSNADLSDAYLIGANLRGANLRGVNLTEAYLRDARGITNEELEQQTPLLSEATMPNGQKYEDWLKDLGHPRQQHTTKFEPALSYDFSGGWKLTTETTDELFFEGPERGNLIFTTPTRVFDPSSPSEPTKVSAPENAKEWVSWFQRHPNLETSKPVPVSVGGASGMQIDVTASSTLEDYPRKICGREPCVPLYPSGGSEILSYERSQDRYVIVDVGGQTVIINVFAPAGKFDAFSPKAQKVLDTVEWKSE